MISDQTKRLLIREFPVDRPEIVCLCGSTRFWELFAAKGLEFTLAGKIVLSIGSHAPDSMTLAHPDTDEGKAQKQLLDDLHKRKIDLCDSIYVINKDGYIGDSTKSEIAYANKMKKNIHWLEINGRTL